MSESDESVEPVRMGEVIRPGVLSISVQQACELTSLSTFSIYEEIYAGRLKAKRYGRRWLIEAEGFKEWFQGLDRYPDEDWSRS
ncbi:helix-turn-helix domain-containing protein [Intrasporangium mesophilum]